MTAKTTDFSGLLFYNPSTNGFNPIVEATMTGPTSVNEGNTATFSVVTWGIPDGPVYWWINGLTRITTDRIAPGLAAEATISKNRSSFTVEVSANNATALGAQAYTINFGKVQNTALSSITVTVNDTSQSPPASLYFDSNNNNYQEVLGTPTDWALGTTWTIEWWSKASIRTIPQGAGLWTVMSQNFNGNGIDITYQDGKLKINNGTEIADEPTPGVWTHVALMNNNGTLSLYYNGTSVYNTGNWNLNNTTDTLMIGKRGPGTFQYFPGWLTGIRITNTVVYTGSFDPYAVAFPPAKIAGTKLLINPGVGALVTDSSDSAHTFNGTVSISEYYPPSVQLTTGTSLSFSGSNQDVQVTGSRFNWALGDYWTIEWWEKIPVDGDGFRGVMSQDSNQPPYAGIDVFHANGQIQMFNSQWSFPEPTRGVWNHIAIQKNGATASAYVNGVAIGVAANMAYGTLSNSTNDLIIGLRSSTGTSPGYSQWFKGELANIRISTGVRYSSTFTPPTIAQFDIYGAAVLVLSGHLGGHGMLDDVSTSNHTITNNNATVTQLNPSVTWPAPATYNTGFRIEFYTSGDSNGLISWFSGKTPFNSDSTSSQVGGAYGASGGVSGLYQGYFVPQVSGSYEIRLTVGQYQSAPTTDIVCNVWKGSDALAPTDGNASFTLSGVGFAGGSVNLVAGDYYPLLVAVGIGSGSGADIGLRMIGNSVPPGWNDGTYAVINSATGRL